MNSQVHNASYIPALYLNNNEVLEQKCQREIKLYKWKVVIQIEFRTLLHLFLITIIKLFNYFKSSFSLLSLFNHITLSWFDWEVILTWM